MKNNLQQQINRLIKQIKHKTYWGISVGMSLESKLSKYKKDGKLVDDSGKLFSLEHIENLKQSLWTYAPSKFNELFPDEDLKKILQWAKQAVKQSEYYERNPDQLSSDKGLTEEEWEEISIKSSIRERALERSKREDRKVIILAQDYENQFILHIENPFEAKPEPITYEDYIYDYLEEYEDIDEVFLKYLRKEYYGLENLQMSDLKKICPEDYYKEQWQDNYSSTKPVYDLYVHLVDEESFDKETYQKIHCVDGGMPGNDFCGIYFDDKESVMAFESAMNDKGENIKIEFVDW